MRVGRKAQWEIPRIAVGERPIKATEQLEQILTQIWYFQFKLFLYLPFILQASTEPRYKYNRLSALSASQEVILQHLTLHKVNTQLCCRIADFAAFIATITIVFNFLNTSLYYYKTDMHQQDKANKNLVQQIVNIVELLSRNNRENCSIKR